MSSTRRIEGVVAHTAPASSVSSARALGGVAGMVLTLVGVWLAASGGAQGFLTCASVAMGAASVALLRRRQARAVGALELTEHGLTLESEAGRESLPWTAVLRWSAHPGRDGETEVHLRCDDGRLWQLTLPGEEAAAVVRDALRRALGRRAFTVPLRGHLDASGWTALVVFLSVAAPLPLAEAVMRVGGALAGFAAWAVGFALAARLVMEVCTSRVTVGGDGVALERGGAERFIPWSEVAGVDWDEYGVILQLRDGDELSLPLLSQSMVRDEGDASASRAGQLRDALHDRIRAELDAWCLREAAPDAMVALLDRQGRTLEDWRAAVRSLVGVAEGYRGVRIDPATAGRVIDDPSAPLERRVAAVWALRDHDRDGARTRVRVALDAAASETVREALDMAVHDMLDERALDRAAQRG